MTRRTTLTALDPFPGCNGHCPTAAIDYSTADDGYLNSHCGRRWVLEPDGGWQVIRGGTPCQPRPNRHPLRPWKEQR